MVQINRVRNVVQGAVTEQAVDAAIVMVSFAGPIKIEEAHPHAFRSIHLRRIHHLHFSHPLRDCVVIQLPDLITIHHVFSHNSRPVAVNFGTGEKNEAEKVLLLHAENVLGPNGVGSPEVFIKILTVPPAEFRRKMIDIIKMVAVKDAFQLTIFGHVAAHILRVMVVREIAHPDLMPPAAQLIHQKTPHCPQSTRNKNFHAGLLASSVGATFSNQCYSRSIEIGIGLPAGPGSAVNTDPVSSAACDGCNPAGRMARCFSTIIAPIRKGYQKLQSTW